MIKGSHRYTLLNSRDGKPEIGKRSAVHGSYFSGVPGFSGVTSLTGFGKNLKGGIIEELVGGLNEQAIRGMCREIYYYDPIAGSYVELLSHLPFDDFSLTEVDDPKILEVYMRSLENLKIKTLLPSLSVDYLTMGAFIGTLDFNQDKKIFDNILPHNIDNCIITSMPIFGIDPIIDVTFPKEMQNLLSSKDQRIQQNLKKIPENILKCMNKGKVALNPLTTLYIARRCFSTQATGISVYRRLLPIYLLEKALLRGTIESAHRRQRGILHIIMGDEEWEPTQENMSDMSNLFQQADSDPLNAIIATRQGVQTQELRAGADFWKYDDIYEMASSYKLRALGINEAFITGDANYNTMETALSVFMEQLKAYRSYITKKVFYEKIFPNIAAANNFLKNEKKNMVTGDVQRLKNSRIVEIKPGKFVAVYSESSNHDTPEIKDITKYEIPTVNWHKQLQPENDQTYMDVLTHMTEQGIPVPIRTMAAAGGMNLDKVLDGKEDDIALRKKIQDYNEEIADIQQQNQIGFSEQSGLGHSVNRVGFTKKRLKQFANIEHTKKNKNGKIVPMSKREYKMIQERINKNISKAIVNVNPYGDLKN